MLTEVGSEFFLRGFQFFFLTDLIWDKKKFNHYLTNLKKLTILKFFKFFVDYLSYNLLFMVRNLNLEFQGRRKFRFSHLGN